MLVALSVLYYWLAHPSDPDASTRVDESLGRCTEPGWVTACVTLPGAIGFLGGPLLLILGGILEFQRRDRLGASLALVGIAAFVFSLACLSLYTETLGVTSCD
jgi:hypothetical protein